MTQVMAHSNVVGGSTAKRVMNCPGSVALCAKMPPKPSSKYADEGTLLHNVMDLILTTNQTPESFVGMEYKDIKLTQELIEDKVYPALQLLDQVDPKKEMEYATETRVGFGDYLPDVFGSTDLLGRIGSRAIILDWKFGSGVAVDAEENQQLMFYAAAAMRTKESQWVFEGATEIECIIVQPPEIRRWVTTPERIKAFENELKMAVQIAQKPNAPLQHGEHCRWCAAKPVCPKMTGAVDRALMLKIEELDAEQIGGYLKNADILEQWITDLRALAHQVLDAGKPVPGWKLVAKRATRQWVDEIQAAEALIPMLDNPKDVFVEKIISPAQAEKLLKKAKKELPKDLVVAISSGSTLAPVDDPRPAVLQIGQQLTAALSKLQ
jgi:CRISPR/Cas system-associated exonuclease Cas4 (RecB family)